MAERPSNALVEPVAALQHHVPPAPREKRAQSIHRLQVGLFGLSAMLLIVSLANIIMDRAAPTDEDDPVEELIAVDEVPKKPASDPLADIGVVPSADPVPAQPLEEPIDQLAPLPDE